jgi:2-methylfumaryl-CoA isomerase
MLSVTGDRNGGPQVDYTVNPAVGFPTATGAEGSPEPVGHVLPAWDCITGQQAALGILAAERHRQRTGKGQLVELALKDVALAMLGNLGIIGEVAINGHDRPKVGNALFGAYAQDFVCADGRRVMVVALTLRQWDNLCAATQSKAACEELAGRLGVDLRREGERFKARHAITALLQPWFAARRVEDFADAFTRLGVTWSEYRTFRQVVEQDPDCSPDNPMFALTEQPGIGSYLAPGLPSAFSEVAREPAARAPVLGEHTGEILDELGYSRQEQDRLQAGGVIARA